MRNGFALLTLGIGCVLFATVSCGKDEATGTTGGHVAHCMGCSHTSDCANGNVCKVVQGALAVCATPAEDNCCDGANGSGNCYTGLGGDVDGAGGKGGGSGGTAGKGGVLNNGGMSGKGGSSSGGSGNTSSGSTRLGSACVSDADCGTTSGLTCLTNKGLSDGGPGKGLCTVPCSTGSECLEISDSAYCYEIVNGESYCVESCLSGTAGVPKCHERNEVACSLIGLQLQDGADCANSDDCDTGQLCDSTYLLCGDIVTGCVPVCAADSDCATGQSCDFATGLCSNAKPPGLPLGSFCDPDANPDPCNGFCLAGSADGEGECSALCVFNDQFTGCGFDGTGMADVACLYATRVSGDDTQIGDVGLCGTLCDCNSQCKLSTDVCIDESTDDMGQPAHLIEYLWGRQGYCRPLLTGETQADSIAVCPDGSTGGGGEGGQSGSGTGGTGGKGGSSSTDGGAGQGGA